MSSAASSAPPRVQRSIELKGKPQSKCKSASTATTSAITAVDQFGSLDKVKLLSHISKIYTDEEYKVKTSVAGAGIGLATVFRSGGSFFFVSESRVRTEVTVFFQKAPTASANSKTSSVHLHAVLLLTRATANGGYPPSSSPRPLPAGSTS